MRERYDARIWAPSTGKAAIARRAGVVTDPFAIGDELPGGIEACRTARAAEVVYWIPEHSALVPGDVLIGDGKGGAKMCPESWLPDGEDAPRPRRVAAAAARPPRAPHPRLARPARRHGRRSRARARARALSAPLESRRRCSGSGSCSASSRSSSSSPPSATTVSSGCATRPTRAGRTSTSSSSAAATSSRTSSRPCAGYAAHERGVFEEVTKARAALQQAARPARPASANDMLTAALGRLFAVAEAYPELKASENFLRLQDDLTDTEDKISAARRYYNSTVMHFNTAIQSIPWVLVARPLGFREKEFFSAEGDTAPPQVSFTPAT